MSQPSRSHSRRTGARRDAAPTAPPAPSAPPAPNTETASVLEQSLLRAQEALGFAPRLRQPGAEGTSQRSRPADSYVKLTAKLPGDEESARLVPLSGTAPLDTSSRALAPSAYEDYQPDSATVGTSVASPQVADRGRPHVAPLYDSAHAGRSPFTRGPQPSASPRPRQRSLSAKRFALTNRGTSNGLPKGASGDADALGSVDGDSAAGDRDVRWSVAHFANLLVAENPTAAHRQFKRNETLRRAQQAGSTRELGSDAGGPLDGGGHSGMAPSRVLPGGGATGGLSGLSAGPSQSLSLAAMQPGSALARNASLNGASQLALGPPPDQPRSHAVDPDDARVTNPNDYWYKLVKRQMRRNVKRRGRRHFMRTLTRLKHSFYRPDQAQAAWPSIQGADPGEHDVAAGPPRHWDWPYVYLMIVFDALTPSIVGSNIAIFLALLIAVVATAYMAMAGNYVAWLLSDLGAVALNSADADAAADARWEIGQGGNTTELHLYGPRVLSRRITNNTHFADQYLVDWGALAPFVAGSGGQGYRYIFSLFVHRSWWHFFILAACALTAGAMMERRYGFFRTFALAVILGCAGTLMAMASVASCTVVAGLTPIAWGFLGWWLVDVGAVMSFWAWRDWSKVQAQLSKWRNISNLMLLTGSALLLVLAESVLGQSSFASAAGGLLTALLLTPALVPRWTSSQQEALSVVMALLGVFIFCVVVPIAATTRVRGLSPPATPCNFGLV